MLSEKVRRLATGGNFASFTTLKADGQPCAQVMWVDSDADHIIINTEVHRAKFTNVQRDPRVVVLIIDKDDQLLIDREDEIIKARLVCAGNEILRK